MTLWLGVAAPISGAGLAQKDNGACLVGEEGIVFAVSEERLSRAKHDCGIGQSVRAALQVSAALKRPIGSAAYSSCGDYLSEPLDVPLPSGMKVTRVPSHHYSHALSAFFASPFDECLIIVMDAGGNTLTRTNSSRWWQAHREQTSIWIGADANVHLLERLQSAPGDIGYGEWYRAFTHFLGWKSHTLSGNTMAAAAYGDRGWIRGPGLWDDDSSGTFGRRIVNEPFSPEAMVGRALRHIGAPQLQPRTKTAGLDEAHWGLAAYVQRSLESSVVATVQDACSRYGVQNVCLTGGVAQNCVMAARLANTIGRERLFVSAYAGDVGQPVGNALYARSLDLFDAEPGHSETVYLGPSPFWQVGASSAVMEDDVGVDHALTHEVAQRLVAGEVVAVCRGRSEFGPRALGNRSVLCDPCSHETVQRVKAAVKRRDDFMPLAPIVSEALVRAWGPPWTRTMTLAPKMPMETLAELGNAVHIDQTSRLQVARPGSFMDEVLADFSRLTGRRALINTSFNERGQPIVQSDADAISAVRRLGIDALVLGNSLYERGSFIRD